MSACVVSGRYPKPPVPLVPTLTVCVFGGTLLDAKDALAVTLVGVRVVTVWAETASASKAIHATTDDDVDDTRRCDMTFGTARSQDGCAGFKTYVEWFARRRNARQKRVQNEAHRLGADRRG